MASTLTKKQFTNPLKNRKKLRLTTLNLFFILFGLFLVTLVITFSFINKVPSPNESAEKIRLEIIRSLLQVLVVTIVGGTVAALFKAHERNQERTKIRIQMKLDFIKRIGELYRIVKSSRRMLKAQEIRMQRKDEPVKLDKEQIAFYSKKIELLNDVQLEIEGLKISAENSFLFENSTEIAEYLWKMENYLNQIVAEFEDNNQLLKKTGKIDLKQLKYLSEFTYHADNKLLHDSFEYSPKEIDQTMYYCFKKMFSLSYGKILKHLR